LPAPRRLLPRAPGATRTSRRRRADAPVSAGRPHGTDRSAALREGEGGRDTERNARAAAGVSEEREHKGSTRLQRREGSPRASRESRIQGRELLVARMPPQRKQGGAGSRGARRTRETRSAADEGDAESRRGRRGDEARD
jgi:hypothetical protein